MKKLKLDLDTLAVESFDTADERGEAGTVRGNLSWTQLESCERCSDWITCPASCGDTCDDPSCEETICQRTCFFPLTCACASNDC